MLLFSSGLVLKYTVSYPSSEYRKTSEILMEFAHGLYLAEISVVEYARTESLPLGT